MDSHDHKAAATALIAWFQSQDIMPADAGMIMTKIMAEQFVLQSRDPRRLQEAVKLSSTLLVLDIAECLRDDR